MKINLKKWQSNTKAQMPVPNPAFDQKQKIPVGKTSGKEVEATLNKFRKDDSSRLETTVVREKATSLTIWVESIPFIGFQIS